MPTLADITAKVRKLTARPSEEQITDLEIQNYINYYYVYNLPDSMKLAKLDDVYTFTTQPNVDTYSFDRDIYYDNKPPVYIGGREAQYYTDNKAFYRDWPKNDFKEQVATSGGAAGPYAFTLTKFPFLRSVNAADVASKVQNILFTASIGYTNTTATDDGIGNILAPGAGVIDYITGACTLTFPVAPLIGVPIYAQVYPYVASEPTSVLFFQNQFVMRPVPDATYLVEVNAMRVPTQLLAAGTEPELNSLWELLAFGAANKILVDNGDYQALEQIRPYFEEQLKFAQRRVIATSSSKRSTTIYSDGGNFFDNNYNYF